VLYCIFIDSPEIGPGALPRPSSSASPTNSPTPLPPSGSSNTGAIAGGVIGGVAMVSIAVIAIFYLRGRRPPVASTGDGATQPMRSQVASTGDDATQPMRSRVASTEDGATHPMSGVGTISRSSGSPPPTYVECLSPNAVAIVYPHSPSSYYFHILRTHTIQLRSQGTKVVTWTSLQLLKGLCHYMSRPEERWGIGRPEPRDIMVLPCPVANLGHLSHRMRLGRTGLLLRVSLQPRFFLFRL
jgi:hypothetical protein